MKDILITVISILLTVLIIVCMVRGLEIGNFQILSISDIKEGSLKLDSEIDNLNNLKNVTYKKKLDDLQTSIKNLTKAKQNYLDLASISSDEEIENANIEQSYAMEFLWNKVGNYATKEGLGLIWNVVSTGVNNKYTLNFTVSGSYIGIINYVCALENDAELAFKIENFKIVSGGTVSSSGTSDSEQDSFKVTATFKVTNIGIKPESMNSSNVSNENEIRTPMGENVKEDSKKQDETNDKRVDKDVENILEGVY